MCGGILQRVRGGLDGSGAGWLVGVIVNLGVVMLGVGVGRGCLEWVLGEDA